MRALASRDGERRGEAAVVRAIGRSGVGDGGGASESAGCFAAEGDTEFGYSKCNSNRNVIYLTYPPLGRRMAGLLLRYR